MQSTFQHVCDSYFLTPQINDFAYMSEAAAPSFPHTVAQNIFGNTSGKVLMLVMTTPRNFTFNWNLTVKTSFLCLLVQLIN